MKHFFQNAMAVADLSRGTVERRSLPEEVLRAENTAPLSEIFPEAVILSAGSLTGSFAPASGLLTAFADGRKTFLTGHAGRALRMCGLDALVIAGSSNAPLGLLLDEKGGSFCPVEPLLDVPSTRAALIRAARTASSSGADVNPHSLVTGPAAFLGCAASCLAQENGTVPRSADLALALAGRGLSGVCFCGNAGFVSPLPLDTPLRTAVPAQRVSRSNLAAVLKAAAGESVRADAVTPGRSLACFACPAPCGFWMSLGTEFVPCTSPEALAALLKAGASEEQAAKILALGEKFGVDALGLTALLQTSALPESPQECAASAASLPEQTRDTELDALAEEVGVCPFFLKRFPAAQAALRAWQTGAIGN